MVKKVKLLPLVLCLAVALCGCEHAVATDVLYPIVTLYEKTPPLHVYFANGSEDDDSLLTEAKLAKLYDTSEAAADSLLDLVADYAVAMSDTRELFEVHIFRPKQGCAADIERMLMGRLKLLLRAGMSENDPTQYYGKIERAEVLRSGEFVCLLVTDDNSLAENYLKSR